MKLTLTTNFVIIYGVCILDVPANTAMVAHATQASGRRTFLNGECRLPPSLQVSRSQETTRCPMGYLRLHESLYNYNLLRSADLLL